MEPAEQISEEWNSLSGVYTAEEADFLNQLLGNCSVPEQLSANFNLGTPSAFWPGHESTIASVLQGSSPSADSSNIFPTTSGGNYSSNNPVINFGYMPMDFSLGDAKFSSYSVQGNDNKQINENTDEEFSLDTGKEVLADKKLQAHKILISEPEEDKTRSLEKSGSGKRSRSSIKVPKNMRTVKSKKNPKSACISNPEEEARSPGPQGQTLSSYCSDDDSNACQELNGGASSSLSPNDSRALKLSGKSRSNRGSATDPQSAYARRRRERINERLRILQNLVPNGTKVDISSMLEEVVQYVKFLQLQIKLLSSDNLWMYAPIAYNGMNILNITPAKQPKEMHSNKRGCSNLKAKGAIL